MDKITSFQGEYRFLSNFWTVLIERNGIQYNSIEAAYQASKTLYIPDRIKISNMTPGQAKRFGRKIELREDWDIVQLPIMYALNQIKFQNPLLKQLLINTGDAKLIEGNTWGDKFWGVCNGQGLNHLGKILMRVRSEINSSDTTEVFDLLDKF